MSIKIKIDEQVFEFSQDYKKVMEIFSDPQIINKINSVEPIQIKVMTKQTFNNLRKACEIVKFDFPNVSKVNTNDLTQVLGDSQLAKFLQGFNLVQINELFKGAKFLKMDKFKKCISAVLACKVYHQPTLFGYIAKKKELNIKQQMEPNFPIEMREKYEFLN